MRVESVCIRRDRLCVPPPPGPARHHRQGRLWPPTPNPHPAPSPAPAPSRILWVWFPAPKHPAPWGAAAGFASRPVTPGQRRHPRAGLLAPAAPRVGAGRNGGRGGFRFPLCRAGAGAIKPPRSMTCGRDIKAPRPQLAAARRHRPARAPLLRSAVRGLPVPSRTPGLRRGPAPQRDGSAAPQPPAALSPRAVGLH